MTALYVFVGLFLIGLGFLVKSYPNLIAGYNTMPDDKKKHVDIDGLSTYMRNGLIILGLTVLVGYIFIWLMGWMMVANFYVFLVVLPGVVMILINARRFDHNKR